MRQNSESLVSISTLGYCAVKKPSEKIVSGARERKTEKNFRG